MATILQSVTQQRLCVDVTGNQVEKKAWILRKYVVLSRKFGVALEHKTALMGITVQPLARSDSVSEKTKSVVRSSRSCGYLTITASARLFNTMFRTTITPMTAGLKSSYSTVSILSVR